MIKRINQIVSIFMGSFIGVFLGNSIYRFWDYRTHPEVYVVQSAPWYTSILFNGIFTLMVLAVCVVLKILLKKKGKIVE